MAHFLVMHAIKEITLQYICVRFYGTIKLFATKSDFRRRTIRDKCVLAMTSGKSDAFSLIKSPYDAFLIKGADQEHFRVFLAFLVTCLMSNKGRTATLGKHPASELVAVPGRSQASAE